MIGRKRKPAELKVLEGTFRKDRDNENKPHPEKGTPDTPAWLVKDAQERYDEVVKILDDMGVLTEVDGGIAALIAQTEYRIMKLNEIIEEQGYSIVDRSRNGKKIVKITPNTLLIRVETLQRQLQAFYAECGLTPASRSKVSKVKKEDKEENNPFSQRA